MDWKTYLHFFVQDLPERKRIADALGIHEKTLLRWTEQQSRRPRIQHLKRLPDLIPPRYREAFLQVLTRAYPRLFPPEEIPGRWPEHEAPQHIPATYYFHILRALAQNDGPMAVWTIYHLSLLQLQSQMPDLQEVALFKCTPPTEQGVVRSLYAVVRLKERFSQTPTLRFSGRESLVGQAVQQKRTEITESCAALLLRRYGAIGGCMYVCSAVPFASWQATLLEEYAALLALSLRPDECYDALDLLTIPPDLVQERFIVGRRDFTLDGTREAELVRQAEALLIQHMEGMQDESREQVCN